VFLVEGRGFRLLPDKWVNAVAPIIENLSGYAKKLLGIAENTPASDIFDLIYGLGEEAIPVITNLRQDAKIRKLTVGLTGVNDAIQNMGVTLREHEEIFIKEKALPLIFKNIVEEDQEEKVRILTNGFESIIYDSMYEEDLLYQYYDVFKNLRKTEIARLQQIYNDEHQDQVTFNLGTFNFERTNIDYIDNKLEQQGLIRSQLIIDGGDFSDPNYEPERPKKHITLFGKEFIKFFRNRKLSDNN
jgi:hypothetical protein